MIGEGSEKAGTGARPGSVIWYERLAWAALGIGLVSAAANPTTLTKYYNLHPIGYPVMFVGALVGQLLWIWLIAHKRQNWARWISLVAIVIGIPGAILDFGERSRLNAAEAIAFRPDYVMLVVAVMLLFRRDAREWFARQRFASELRNEKLDGEQRIGPYA